MSWRVTLSVVKEPQWRRASLCTSHNRAYSCAKSVSSVFRRESVLSECCTLLVILLRKSSTIFFCITNMRCSLCGSAVEGLKVLLQSAAFSRFLLALVPKLLLLQSGLGWLQPYIYLRWRKSSNIFILSKQRYIFDCFIYYTNWYLICNNFILLSLIYFLS